MLALLFTFVFMKSYKIEVSGRVQGVFFRYYTKQTAEKLGLLGTVQNQPDGSVLIYVQGNDKEMDEFIKWCHQGSPPSKVDTVEVSDWPPSIEYHDFQIIR